MAQYICTTRSSSGLTESLVLFSDLISVTSSLSSSEVEYTYSLHDLKYLQFVESSRYGPIDPASFCFQLVAQAFYDACCEVMNWQQDMKEIILVLIKLFHQVLNHEI
jgi:hypothetical protein